MLAEISFAESFNRLCTGIEMNRKLLVLNLKIIIFRKLLIAAVIKLKKTLRIPGIFNISARYSDNIVVWVQDDITISIFSFNII